jgi:hypothetical protein
MLGWWCPPIIKYNIKYDFLSQHVDFSCILIQTGEKIENMCKSLPETMTSLRQSALPVSSPWGVNPSSLAARLIEKKYTTNYTNLTSVTQNYTQPLEK